MGYKPYGDEPVRSRVAEFCEWFFAVFMTFSSCVGGWLVHFGMSAVWMLIITFFVAISSAYLLSITHSNSDN